MAITLGTIALDLIVNHGKFLSGFSEAGLASKKFRSEFEHAFEGMGNLASQLLAPLGQFGATIGETISQVGRLGAAASGSLGNMSGALGRVGVVGGIAAGAVAAITLGSLELAAKTAESAAKMGLLAQSTGVSTETLSGFAFVAKQSGVDQEVMTKGLERLSKAILKAAIDAPGTANAFTRLGISVRESNGGIKNAGQIMTELAGKFAGMEDGAVKTGLAMQLFGRGGAALIPILNQGRDGIQHWIDVAGSLGLILSTETAESAHKFVQALNTMEGAGQGAALRLMEDLLPALRAIADRLVTSFDTGAIQALIDKIAEVVKSVLTFGYELTQISKISVFGNLQAGLDEAMGATAIAGAKTHLALLNLPFLSHDPDKIKKANEAVEAAYRHTAEQVNKDIGGISWEQAMQNVDKFKHDLEPATEFPVNLEDLRHSLLSAKPLPKKALQVDTKPQKDHRDLVADTIGNLKAQTAEEAALANAISDVTSNTILNIAAAEAEKTIAQTNTKLAADKRNQGRQLTESEKTQIRELTTLKDAYDAAYKDNKGLAEFIQKTNVQADSLGKLATAYANETPLAIEQAKEMEKLAPFAKQISDIQGVISSLRQLGASPAQLAPLLSSLDNMQNLFLKGKDAAHQLFLEEENVALGKAVKEIDSQTDAILGSIPAILAGTDALRAYNIEQQVKKFAEANPLVSAEPLRRSLNVGEDAKRSADAANAVIRAQSFLTTKSQIDDLELLRTAQVRLGGDTSAIDLLLFQNRTKYIEEYRRYVFDAQNAQLLGDARLFDLQSQLARQWDDAAFKVGTFGAKFKGVMNELILQGKGAGAEIAGAFLTAIDGVETQFAKLLTGQKANFKQVFQSLAESVAKAEIKSAVGSITQRLGLGGIGAKADGSSESAALWVRFAGDSLGGVGGGEAGASGGLLGGIFGKIAKKLGLGGATGSGEMTGITGGGGGGGGFLGGLLGVLGSAFAGMFSGGSMPFAAGALGAPSALAGVTGATGSSFSFGPGGLAGLFPGLAEGGDVMPGHGYVVGEKHPEFFVPKEPGEVIPTLKTGSSRQPMITNNFHGFKDNDMFRRSEAQLTQAFHRQMSIATSRA